MKRSEAGAAASAYGYGPLVDMGDLALPEGFGYTVISREGETFAVYWVKIDNPDPYSNNVRYQAQSKGAAIFGREEGAWTSGGNVYFDCTDGGDAGLGQIWEYDPIASTLTLIYESHDATQLKQPDNLCVCPTNGCLFVCEDTSDPHIRGLTPDGRLFTFSKALSNTTAEFCGATFDPSGATLFVNQMRPGITYAIRGPWQNVA